MDSYTKEALAMIGCLIGLLIIVLFGTYWICTSIDQSYCPKQWPGRETRYEADTCLVKVNGVWVPARNIIVKETR